MDDGDAFNAAGFGKRHGVILHEAVADALALRRLNQAPGYGVGYLALQPPNMAFAPMLADHGEQRGGAGMRQKIFARFGKRRLAKPFKGAKVSRLARRDKPIALNPGGPMQLEGLAVVSHAAPIKAKARRRGLAGLAILLNLGFS
jgi:hypothetical protein